MTPRITSVPADDYRHQWGLLISGIMAAVGERSADSGQIAALKRHVLPRIETVQRLNRTGDTDQVPAVIGDARAQFTRIMGQHWQPAPSGQVAQAMRAKGVDPSTITT